LGGWLGDLGGGLRVAWSDANVFWGCEEGENKKKKKRKEKKLEDGQRKELVWRGEGKRKRGCDCWVKKKLAEHHFSFFSFFFFFCALCVVNCPLSFILFLFQVSHV